MNSGTRGRKMGNIELDYVDICRRIRAERRRQNMTQEALAELAELSPTSVSHIERGATKLSLPTLVRLSNALLISADTLLCGSLAESKGIYIDELADLLKDCDRTEIRVITEMVKSLKESLDHHYPSRTDRENP